MEKAKEQGHEIKHCIVVRHLQRLNAFFESKTQNHNGCNGDAKNHYDEVRLSMIISISIDVYSIVRHILKIHNLETFGRIFEI